MTNNSLLRSIKNDPGPGLVFSILWILLFVLYLPAARAGFVSDFTGWLDQVSNHSFMEHLNRTNYGVRSLYQFTQLVTYIFYKLFGINPWLWHILFLTMHVTNATLMYILSRRLLDDAVVSHSGSISFAGVLLFCVSPYMSEAIVWEPSFHFLQGLLFILLVLLWVQRYVHTGQKKYIWLSLVIYSCSVFALEVFYVTPWMALALGLFYRYQLPDGKEKFRQVAVCFFIPLLLLFCLRIGGYYMVYHSLVSRIDTSTITDMKPDAYSKPAKYIFHLLFLGRFFPEDMKHHIYDVFDSVKFIAAFWAIVVAICLYVIIRVRHINGRGRVAALLFVWMVAVLLPFIPMWFYDTMLVIMDRYVYAASAFFYMLFSVLVSFITVRYVRVAIIAVFVLINLRFTIRVNRYWWKSDKVNRGLLYSLPPTDDKIIVLLNLPENMHGIPMIGTGRESEYKLMHNLLLRDRPVHNTVYDILSYNMQTPGDGVHVTVLTDSTLRVTLNQWGTWWWRGGDNNNADLKTDIVDPGHWYLLTLKKPADRYLLLYQVGDKLKTVDMSKKQADQY